MRVEAIISHQIRNGLGQNAWYDHSQGMSATADKALLMLYSSILSEAINTNVPVSERHIDATQEALTRKAVVEKSHVRYKHSR
jgi:hypothetical protein